VHINPAGQLLLRENAVLEVVHGVLRTRRQEEVDEIARRLKEMKGAGAAAHGGSILALCNRQEQPVMLLTFQPFQLDEADTLVLLRMADLLIRPVVEATFLVQVFGLTQGEARVVASIFTGHDIAGSAAALHLGQETVRSHLKAAMGKMGVSSQGKLNAVLLIAQTTVNPGFP